MPPSSSMILITHIYLITGPTPFQTLSHPQTGRLPWPCHPHGTITSTRKCQDIGLHWLFCWQISWDWPRSKPPLPQYLPHIVPFYWQGTLPPICLWQHLPQIINLYEEAQCGRVQLVYLPEPLWLHSGHNHHGHLTSGAQVPATKEHLGQHPLPPKWYQYKKWHTVLGEPQSMVLALPGAWGIFSQMKKSLYNLWVSHVTLSEWVNQTLQNFRWMSTTLAPHTT